MIKIAICDDDSAVAESIESHLMILSAEYRKKFEIDVYYSGEKLGTFFEEQKYDLLFIDIEMPRISGIDTVKLIRELNQDALVIFISSHKTYFEQLFDVQPFNFLHKPIDWEKFDDIFNKAYLRIIKPPKYFWFSSERASYRIPIDEILQFESVRRKIYLTTSKGRYELYGTLKEIYSQFSDENFIYVSQSDLVNMRHIQKIYPDYIVLSDDRKVYISRRKQAYVREQFKKMWMEEINV